MADSLKDSIEAQGFASVIVALKPSKRTSSTRARAFGLAAPTKPDDIEESAARLAKHFTLPQAAQRVAIAASSHMPKPRSAMRVYPNLGLMLGVVDSKGLAALRKSSDVKAVRAAPVLSLIRPVAKAALTGPPPKITWGLARLKIPNVWERGYTGKDVIVGHLDTGIDGSHPALQGAVRSYAEFNFQGDLVPEAKARDSDEHGTHTAGTIAGRMVEGTHFGVAPGAVLASAMVIEGGDVVARVLGGMDWVIGEGARILSMSLGLRGYWPDFLELTQILRTQGVLPVFAIGNEGAGTSRSPGNYAEALAVGACAQNDTVADFSSSHKFVRPADSIVPDLVAPGVDILSCTPNGGYAQFDGSSMATPHVAGLAALLLEAKPDATVSELEKAILASCKRPAGMALPRCNRGVPDAERALAVLVKKKKKATSIKKRVVVRKKASLAKTKKRAWAKERKAA